MDFFGDVLKQVDLDVGAGVGAVKTSDHDDLGLTFGAPVHSGLPGKAPAADPAAAVKSRLLGIMYGVKQKREELEAASGGAGIERGRVTRLILDAHDAMNELRPAVAELAPADLARLLPIAQGLVAEIASVYSRFDQNEDLSPLFGEFVTDANSTFGHPFVTQRDLTFTARRQDALAGAREQLAAAGDALDAARKRYSEKWTADAEPADLKDEDGSIRARLASAHGFLEDSHPEDRKQLQPVVLDLASRVTDVGQYVRGALIDEVVVRTSDIMTRVSLMQRLSGATMVDLLKHEKMAGRGYSDEQLARFGAAAETIKDVQLGTLFAQLNGVITAESEANVKDPPKPEPWWKELAMELAFAAISSVTLGIGGKIVGKIGSLVGEGSGFGEAGALRKVIQKHFTDGANKALSESFGAVKNHVLADGEAAPELGGAGLSSYYKVAFFGGQRQTLIQTWMAKSADSVEEIRDQRTALKEDPEAAIAMVRLAAECARLVNKEATAFQMTETREKYVALIARMSMGTTAHHTEIVPDIQKVTDVDQSSGAGNKVGFDKSYAGVVSMDASMDEDPAAPIVLTKAWVTGLNAGLRDQIINMRLADAGIPMRLQVIGREGTIALPGAFAAMASDGEGGIAVRAGLFGEAWLHGRMTATGAGSYEEVARRILEDEIGSRPLKEQVKVVGEE